MFKFLKGTKKKGKDEAIDAEELLSIEEGKPAEGSDDEVETKLSIPDDWKISDEERYVFAFHNSQSPKLKTNQISLYGMELTQTTNGDILVTGLVRSTVTQHIQFGDTSILLLDKDRKPLARKAFDLGGLGTVPPNSARPWNFSFKKEDLLTDIDEEINDWSLAFELKRKHQLELEDSWENSIDEETKRSLEQIVEQAPALKSDEVNFLGVNALQKENGDLVVTILIRNGNDKNISFEKIPLGIKDASNEEIARGSFTLDNLTVSANTSKPWTFIFPKPMVKKENIDLSRWQAFPIQ